MLLRPILSRRDLYTSNKSPSSYSKRTRQQRPAPQVSIKCFFWNSYAIARETRTCAETNAFTTSLLHGKIVQWHDRFPRAGRATRKRKSIPRTNENLFQGAFHSMQYGTWEGAVTKFRASLKSNDSSIWAKTWTIVSISILARSTSQKHCYHGMLVNDLNNFCHELLHVICSTHCIIKNIPSLIFDD